MSRRCFFIVALVLGPLHSGHGYSLYYATSGRDGLDGFGYLVCSDHASFHRFWFCPHGSAGFIAISMVPTDAVVLVALLDTDDKLGDLSRVVGAFWIA